MAFHTGLFDHHVYLVVICRHSAWWAPLGIITVKLGDYFSCKNI